MEKLRKLVLSAKAGLVAAMIHFLSALMMIGNYLQNGSESFIYALIMIMFSVSLIEALLRLVCIPREFYKHHILRDNIPFFLALALLVCVLSSSNQRIDQNIVILLALAIAATRLLLYIFTRIPMRNGLERYLKDGELYDISITQSGKFIDLFANVSSGRLYHTTGFLFTFIAFVLVSLKQAGFSPVSVNDLIKLLYSIYLAYYLLDLLLGWLAIAKTTGLLRYEHKNILVIDTALFFVCIQPLFFLHFSMLFIFFRLFNRPPFNSTQFKAGMIKIVEHRYFERIMSVVIIAGGIIVGLQTWHWLSITHGSTLKIIDDIIVGLFVIEILFKCWSNYPYWLRFFDDPWHWFDFIIVAVCVIPIFLPNIHTEYFAVFRLVRFARILRVVTIFEKIPNLRTMLNALGSSIKSIVVVIAILILQFYIFGIIGTDLFGAMSQDKFGSLFASMQTLFFVMFEGYSGVTESEGIQKLIASGFPEWVLNVYFIIFIFLGALIFLNLFIGIITSEMAEAKTEEKRGKTAVHEHGHIIILGWSEHIITIIKEFIAGVDKYRIHDKLVVMADRDVIDMESSVNFHIFRKEKRFKTISIVFRKGVPWNINDLAILSVENAKSIIILSDESTKTPDVMVTKTLLALHQRFGFLNPDVTVIAEMIEDKNIISAREIFFADENKAATNASKPGYTLEDKNVVFLPVKDIISKLITQTCLQPGLATVYSEIFSFEGHEFYLKLWDRELMKKITGDKIDFKKLSLLFAGCCPVGFIDKDGKIRICPKEALKQDEIDRLIVLSEDNLSVMVNRKNPTAPSLPAKEPSIANNGKRTKSILILGKDSKIPRIIAELAKYEIYDEINITLANNKKDNHTWLYDRLRLAGNDDVNVLPDPNNKQQIEIKREHLNIHIGFNNDIDICSYDSLASVFRDSRAMYDHVILLSNYDRTGDIQQADGKSLMTLIHLWKILSWADQKFSVLTELIDSHNRELASRDGEVDVVISSNIISSLIPQITRNRKIYDLFEDIFDAEGYEIYLKPLSDYLDSETMKSKPTFRQLQEICFAKNEALIGFKLKNEEKARGTKEKDGYPFEYGFSLDGHTFLNPHKDIPIGFSDNLCDDRLIVISEDYTGGVK